MTSGAYSEFIPKKPGHYVYRLWAADGTCLYVGCVGERTPRRVRDRLGDHERKQPWWPEVVRVEVAAFESAAQIAAEEPRQIAEHHPVHNKRLLDCPVHPGAARAEQGGCKSCRLDYHRSYRASAHGRATEAERLARAEVKAARSETGRRYKRKLRLRRVGPASGQAPLW